MPHSTGQQLSRCLLSMLAFASPLLAQEDEGKLAPIIDLNPRHNEAATSSLEEPSSLIVAADAMPLLGDTDLSAGLRSMPQRDSSAGHKQPQPAVRFAPPFDPTRGVQPQQHTTLLHVSQDTMRLAPVIHVYEPIRQNQKTDNSIIAAERLTEPNKPPATRSPVLEPVNRSVFLPTREDRLERTNAGRAQPLQKHDTLTSRMLAAFEPSPKTKSAAPTVNRNAAQSSAVIQPAAVSTPQRLGVVQLAAEDPISANSELQKPRQSTPRERATKLPWRPVPLVMAAERSPIELRQTEVVIVSDPGIEVVGAAKVASPANLPISPKQELEQATAATKRSSPVVELGTKRIIRQSPTVSLLSQPALASKPQPVLKLIEQRLPERLAPTESVVLARPPAATALPVTQLADAKPLLAVLQPSPAAADLPAPMNEPPLAEEQMAQELEAFELDVKPIHELSTLIKPEAGELPKNYAAARFVREGEVPHRMGFSRSQSETWMSWEAPALCYRSLYFEDINLERHGYKIPLIQPALSAAHFFGRVPLMPYMMVSEGYRDCRYTLGHYRPSDYAPYSLYIPRLRLDASAAELAVAAGLIFAFP